MPKIQSIASLVHQWYRLRTYAHRKSCEELIRDYQRLERSIGSRHADSAQEALTQLRIAVTLWQEDAFTRDLSGFLKKRRNAMHAMFNSAIGYLKQKADIEQL